jgi:glycosyltransferase involved in cell wall biosynthesis
MTASATPATAPLDALPDAARPDAAARPRPQVSFVVPAYNEERLLPACLAAIRAEIEATGCTAEVFVVNNASTDGTAAIAAGTPGVVVVDQPVKGLVQARSAGFLASRGVLVANIDADTLIPPGWLARVLREFDSNPRLVVVSGPYDYYDVPVHIRAFARGFYLMGYATYAFNKHVLGVGAMVQGGNFVMVSDAMAGIGGYSDAFTFYGEDTDVARRMSKVGDVVFTFKLTAKSSGRRLRGDGVLRTGIRYGANYLWATFLRKPFTTAWNDYR